MCETPPRLRKIQSAEASQLPHLMRMGNTSTTKQLRHSSHRAGRDPTAGCCSLSMLTGAKLACLHAHARFPSRATNLERYTVIHPARSSVHKSRPCPGRPCDSFKSLCRRMSAAGSLCYFRLAPSANLYRYEYAEPAFFLGTLGIKQEGSTEI
jgi:hypothetical protein